MDTAAILRNVDLTICCDTSVLHLAGALGAPVWLAQMFSSDWRWLLEREDSPWYPSLRLFRQKSLGDWDDVFQRMARAVRERLEATPRQSPAHGASGATLHTQEGQDAVRVAATIAVEISPGELIDKITILEIKSERLSAGRRVDRQDREIRTERIPECDQLHNVRTELVTHEAVRDRAIAPSAELALLTSELKLVNESLWQIEDHLRDAERVKEFGAPFVELARSVYKTNDRRSALKKQINELLHSRLHEEKMYSTC
jgi:hypothetical protein